MADIKTTAQIRAAPEEFKAACARATEAFRKIKGFVSVSYGLKQTAGVFSDDIAMVVFVDEKKPLEALAPAERIPELFEGYRTDVRIVGFHQSGLGHCDNRQTYKTIQGGIQISNAGRKNAAGTEILRELGTVACIVRRRNFTGRENVYLLSNAHVMYAEGYGRGDPIGHPAIQEGEAIGIIMDGAAFHNIAWPPGIAPPNPLPVPGDPDDAQNHPDETFLDCAIARLELDSCCGCTENTRHFAESSIVDLVVDTPVGAERDNPVHASNRITDVRDVFGDPNFNGELVTKVGRTSGHTTGKCVNVNRPFRMPNPLGSAPATVHCYNCIEIIPEPPGAVTCGQAYFGQHGDSGSLVVDAQRRAVGLLFSVPVAGAPANASCGACHIVPVLDHLGICIPCAPGATGHGSATAADGSGVAPAPLPAAQSTLPTGSFVFLADGAAPASQAAAVFTPPMPVNAAHEKRMRALLEEFRATQLGRPLSAVINEVRREIGYLVRNVRPVKIAWGRHQGPAWLAHVLNHIAGHTSTLPHEIKGVTRRAVLLKMREVLSAHGSNPLKRALAEYGDVVLELLTSSGCDSVADLVAWVQARERERDVERIGGRQPAETEDVS
jgi:hypothetical protein